MRSREPWRLPAGQSRAVPFLQAAVLFAALCIFARSAALVLAAFLAAPVPAAQTLLHLGQQAVESRAAESSAESAAEAASVPPEQETAAPVQTGVERYFVSLQPDEACGAQVSFGRRNRPASIKERARMAPLALLCLPL